MENTVVVGGMRVAIPADAGFKPEKEIELPSGLMAQIRKGKGRDLLNAQRAVPADNTNPMALVFAIIAETSQIEGNALTYDGLMEMDLADVMMLQAEVVGTSFLPSMESPSKS